LITTWYDQKIAANKSSIVAVGTGPTYSNTINYIHAVKFNGSNANYLKIADASFLNNTDYTIVVLEKRQSATAGYFIGDSAAATANQALLLGYSADDSISHSQGTGNAYSSFISNYSNSSDTPRIFTFVSDSTNGKKTYINGILAAQSANTTKLSNITELAIGKGYTGEIGEIAIFTHALKNEERKAIEDYLEKKFSAKVNRNAIASGSCINGIVTTNGCTMNCSTASVVGLSSPSTVVDGTSTTGTCGVTGYSGTVALSCGSGTGVLSASPSMCGCAAGYSLLGGVCTPTCSYAVTGGSPSTGSVTSGSGIINCNTASNYSSSGYAYTCSGGTAITGTCACATGYTGAGCSACDAANGYMSSGGACVPTCTIPLGSGTTLTRVALGTTSTVCNSSGYAGTLTYTCSTGGSPISVVTTCLQTCTGGNIDTTTVPGSIIHIFTSSGTLTCPSSKTAQVLVVAGGGGGGSASSSGGGGGGGGGGVVYAASYPIAATSYAITVGDGGASVNGLSQPTTSLKGSDSVFGTITAKGGGGGGGWSGSSANASNGGSGGGAGSPTPAAAGASNQTAQTNGTNYYGNQGAPSPHATYTNAGGGGGGAGAIGALKNGGNGISNSITGSSVTYAGGGGGSGEQYTTGTGGTGGTGGGGNGGGGFNGASGTSASSGTANTGGGGGGACSNNSGAGGKGIVIVRY
jgi:hypothetical protein